MTATVATVSGISVLALAKHASAIRDLVKSTRENIVEIGRHLAGVRERIDHGKWLGWLNAEFGWSDQTARNFIRVFELSRDAKFQNILNLNLPLNVLYQVAAPKSEVARTEIVERIEAGEEPSRALVTEVIAKTKTKVSYAQDRSAAAVHGEQSIVPLEERQAQMAALDTAPELDSPTDGREESSDAAQQVNGTPPACRSPPASVSAKSSKKDLLEAWDAAPEERELIRDLVLEEYFAEAGGTDLYDRIPADRRAEVVRAFLDRLTADAMCEVMSPEFGKKLRDRMPAPKRKSESHTRRR
jgi:hypothetical protein